MLFFSVCYTSMSMSKRFSSLPPPPFEDGVVTVINDWLMHFADHLVIGVTLTSHSSICAIRYIYWLKLISHSYILSGHTKIDHMYYYFVIHIVWMMTRHERAHNKSMLVQWVISLVLCLLLFYRDMCNVT